MPPTKHMKMKMEDGLSCIATGIRDQSIAGLPQTFQGCYLRAAQEQFREQRFIIRPQILNGRDMALGDHQGMDRRLRIDVVKSQCVLILLNQLCRNLLLRDFTKEAVAHLNLYSHSMLP